jgi:fibro-slime domain-containing protein
MLGWKRCLLMGVLAGAVGCGSNEDDGDGASASQSDGGGSVMTGDAAVTGNGGLDGGLDGGARKDSSVRADANSGTGEGGEGDNADCNGLTAKVRDFSSVSHEDFEKYNGSGTKGLLESTLGTDDKPIFKTTGMPVQITSASSFKQWYNDTPGVNIAVAVPLPLTPMPNNPNSYEFVSDAFFPIDNKGFAAAPTNEPMRMGEDGKLHNFSFTTEVHTSFTYRGKEVFSFNGDDDLWIFVNGKLALDLGGLHSSQDGTIDFDTMAAQLGIEIGKTYKMDIFHAERHTTASHFKIRTNIECFKTPPIVI